MPVRNNSLNRYVLPSFWQNILRWIGQNNDTQVSTRFEWSVVAFATGISLYFAAPFEPQPVAVISCVAVILVSLLLTRPDARNLRSLLFGLCFICLGVGRSGWHSHAAATPKLSSYESAYWVTGWVSAIEKSGPRLRWQINVSDIAELNTAQTPRVIRTSTGGTGVQAGDFIRIRSVLSAPRGPAVPGGYDPARRAFYAGIGGSGYAISKAEVIEDLPLTLKSQIQRQIIKVRYRLADRVLNASPVETAGLQVGLLTGIRTYIPEDQTDVLRTAGLAHILAISGLHMGLMAGSVYFLAALGFACISPLSRRYDMRKSAAVIGLVAATAYLILSGASVATQRAFIMTCIVFFAVILDRRAFSMRSVALAAAITLLLHPEAIVGAGFQMSFAAVAALVAVYRAWDNRRVYTSRGVFGRAGQSLKSLSVTSFVAGTATSGFAMLHFNRVASYGLAGNLLAMPVFTFLVMPAGLAVFPAMLIGQEHLPLVVMGFGLQLMLSMSEWVAGWPEAILHIPAGPSWVIGFFGLSFAALCLGPRFARVCGAITLVLCVGIWLSSRQPDMRVSSDGAVAFWAESGPAVLYVNRKRADKYGREQFARRAGEGDWSQKTYDKQRANCDPLGCRLRLKGFNIAITSNPSEVIEECQNADIVILTERAAGPVARRRCKSKLIDARIIGKSGAQNIFLGTANIRIETANPEKRVNRPWGK